MTVTALRKTNQFKGKEKVIFLKFIFWTCLFLVGYSYILYPILLVVFDKVWIRKRFEKSDELPGISIVIAAYNEEKVIKSRLANCLKVDYPRDKLEIIIASDGSDDRTCEIVRKYSDKGIVLYDYKERRGKVNVLNETVPNAKNNIIVFSDANTMFAHDALVKIVRNFGDERVGCVCGGLHFVNPKDGNTGELEGIYWKYETVMKIVEGRHGFLLGCNGAIYAIRKELYEKCEEDTIIEDFVLPMRILQKGRAVIYDPGAVAIEESAAQIIQEKHRRIRIGAGDFQALFRLLPMLNPLRGLSAIAFLSHKVLRWFAPFFLIIIFLSNLFLLKEKLYLMVYAAQCFFYMSAIIGQLFNKFGINLKGFSLCYYFVSMNVALFLGFFRYIKGTQSVAWLRTER